MRMLLLFDAIFPILPPPTGKMFPWVGLPRVWCSTTNGVHIWCKHVRFAIVKVEHYLHYKSSCTVTVVQNVSNTSAQLCHNAITSHNSVNTMLVLVHHIIHFPFIHCATLWSATPWWLIWCNTIVTHMMQHHCISYSVTSFLARACGVPAVVVRA